MPMNRSGTAVRIAVATVVCIFAFGAHAADVDWIMYGAASVAGPEICFYESASVVLRTDGHLRVWTKCLAEQEIHAAFNEQIISNAARKLLRAYVPPIASIESSIDFDRAGLIIGFEETANIGNVKPHSSILYELDCSEKMLRELSITIEVNGQYGSRNTPSDWIFVPPEGNGTNLLKLLCRMR